MTENRIRQEAADELSWRLAQAEEADIRNGLIALGWMPPEVTAAALELAEAVRLIREVSGTSTEHYHIARDALAAFDAMKEESVGG